MMRRFGTLAIPSGLVSALFVFALFAADGDPTSEAAPLLVLLVCTPFYLPVVAVISLVSLVQGVRLWMRGKEERETGVWYMVSGAILPIGAGLFYLRLLLT